MLTNYKKYLRSIGLKPSTVKSYSWHLNKFLEWLKERKLTEKELKEYYQVLIRHYHKINTINLRLKIINSYLKFLGKRFRYELLSNPPEQIKLLNKNQLDQFLTNAEKDKSLIGLRNKALLELIAASGLKTGQVIQLKRDQLDELSQEIIIPQKNHLAISPLAWFYLKQYLNKRKDDSPWLFVNFDRSQKSAERQLTIRSVERIAARYARGLNPPLTITPQVLRNTLAYQLKSAGAKTQEIKIALRFETKSGAKNYLDRL